MSTEVSRGLPEALRWIDAGNAGPFTLEGTRTHIVGRRRAAVVDPGPASDRHVAAIADELERGGAEEVVVLVTHAHADHSGAAPELVKRVGAQLRGAWASGGEGEGGGGSRRGPPAGFRPLEDGERVHTDAGDLIALATPGHARAHLSFHWPDAEAVFVGDLLLGSGDTTWVGEYPGCVADYLASLERVDALGTALMLPAHGPPVLDPHGHILRYRDHRLARVAQVERALREHPGATADDILRAVYGRAVPTPLAAAALASVAALMEHVRTRGSAAG